MKDNMQNTAKNLKFLLEARCHHSVALQHLKYSAQFNNTYKIHTLLSRFMGI